ncbi:recombinase family protein [Pseudomonas tremae]|uniref:recombinase family protein n=1 Tax=Pseudomonas syringae group TaxID=136849 RepID=UPI0001AF502F|nr:MULTISPECIES: recombinase family protein [Pseudomonas syringae group]MCQ3015904.1 recombinase family protein [Pseudomonas tremae]
MLSYFLVGTDGQETLPKLEAIEMAQDVVHWFSDMGSVGFIGALERPGFGELHQFARKGDILIVPSLDCLGGSATELLEVFQALREKEVAVISVREGLHLFAFGGVAVEELLAEALTGKKGAYFLRLG